jgi:hypothetical protein
MTSSRRCGEESQGGDDGSLEDVAHPTSRLGDCWVLGPQRVQCGDSTDAADVAALMLGEQAGRKAVLRATGAEFAAVALDRLPTEIAEGAPS